MSIAKRIFILLIFWVAASAFSAALLPASENNPSTDEVIIKTSEITAVENTVIDSQGSNSPIQVYESEGGSGTKGVSGPRKSILNTNTKKAALSKKKPRSRSEAEAAGWKTKTAQGPVPVKNLIKEVSQETKARQERLKAKLEKRKQRDKLIRQGNR